MFCSGVAGTCGSRWFSNFKVVSRLFNFSLIRNNSRFFIRSIILNKTFGHNLLSLLVLISARILLLLLLFGSCLNFIIQILTLRYNNIGFFNIIIWFNSTRVLVVSTLADICTAWWFDHSSCRLYCCRYPLTTISHKLTYSWVIFDWVFTLKSTLYIFLSI